MLNNLENNFAFCSSSLLSALFGLSLLSVILNCLLENFIVEKESDQDCHTSSKTSGPIECCTQLSRRKTTICQ